MDMGGSFLQRLSCWWVVHVPGDHPTCMYMLAALSRLEKNCMKLGRKDSEAGGIRVKVDFIKTHYIFM